MGKKHMVSWAKAKLAVSRRLLIVSERTLERRLAAIPLSTAEAYVLGAEEAQDELIRRINLLKPAETNGGMRPTCPNCGHEPCAAWCNAPEVAARE